MMYHPWREVRRPPHLVIEFADLPDDHRGCLSGSKVTINADDLQAEQRCTLTHELVHGERQVFPIEPVLAAREEVTVERIAARRLIRLEQLVEVPCWPRTTPEAAAELWVDVPMLVTFVQSLTDGEQDWTDEQLRERGAA